jgi:hypothetical protein
MWRITFNIASFVSAILLIIALILWVRGFFALDVFCYVQKDEGGGIGLSCSRGVVLFWWIHDKADEPFRWSYSSHEPWGAAPGPTHQPWGLARTSWNVTFRMPGLFIDGDVRMTSVIVSDWLAALVTGTLPATWVWRYLVVRRRNRKGLCPRCGYDLRASRERCPECGMPIDPP